MGELHALLPFSHMHGSFLPRLSHLSFLKSMYPSSQHTSHDYTLVLQVCVATAAAVDKGKNTVMDVVYKNYLFFRNC